MTEIAPRCRLPVPMFAELAAGGGGVDVIRRLRQANRSRTLLAIGLIATETARQAHADAPVVAAAYRVLDELREQAPDAAARVLDDPAVGMWAIGTARGLAGTALAARPGALAQIAAAVAVRAGLPAELGVAGGPDLRLPSLGTMRLPGPAIRIRPGGAETVVTGGGQSVRIPGAVGEPAAGWRPMVTAALGARTVPLEDWAFTSLPGGFAGEPQSPAPSHATAWSEMLTASVRLLEHHGLAGTITETLRSIGPLRSRAQNSATLADAFGCVLMTLPSDARTGAVTLVHEVQHAKLAALMDLVPLVESVASQRFYAPWRQDPRPLLGLLHGAYAYLGIIAFWRRQRQFEQDSDAEFIAEVEFARWRQATTETVHTIVSRPELTSHGRTFTEYMSATLAEMSSDSVSASARKAAERLNNTHRARWKLT